MVRDCQKMENFVPPCGLEMIVEENRRGVILTPSVAQDSACATRGTDFRLCLGPGCIVSHANRPNVELPPTKSPTVMWVRKPEVRITP